MVAAGNITEYTNPVTGLSPTETGIDAIATAARRAGQFFNQAAETGKAAADQGARGLKTAIEEAGSVAVKAADAEQISHGAAAMAAFTEQKTKAWDQRIKGYTDDEGVVHPPADPNDPTVATKFMGDMEQDFDKIRSSFWTENSQKWAESHIEHLRNHFTTHTQATMANLAADAAKTNTLILRNKLSNAAMLNPAGVDDFIAQAKSGISGIVNSSPNLKGEASVRTNTALTEAAVEQIVKAYAIGAVRQSRDPEKTADEVVRRFPQYINGAEVKQIANEARTQQRLNNVEVRAARQQAKDEKRERADKAADDLELDTTKIDEKGQLVPTVPPNAKDRLNALKDAGASPGRISTLVTRMERIGAQEDENTKRNLETRSRQTQADLFGQTRDGIITSKDAYDKAYREKQITWEARNQLINDFDADKSATGQKIAQRRNETIKAMEAVVDSARVSLGQKSAAGSIALSQYEQWLRVKEEDARKNNKDPQSIYDYDVNGNSIALQGAKQFRVSAMGAIRSKLESLRPGKVDDTPVPVKDPSDVVRLKLKSGTKIILPDGRIGTVP